MTNHKLGQAAATLACALLLGALGAASAQGAVVHEFEYKIEGFAQPTGLAVGPAEPEATAHEPSALYVADHGAGVVDRFDAAGAALAFTCVAEAKCPAGVEANEANKLVGSSATGSGTLTAASKEITGVTRATGAFSAGQEISAPGLPEGTKIAAVKAGGVLEVSEAATKSESASLMAHQKFRGGGGVAVDDKTGEVFVYVEEAVDIFASTGEYVGQIAEVPESSGAEVYGVFYQASGLAFDQETGELYVAHEGRKEEEGRPAIPDVIDVFERQAPGELKYLRQFGGGVLYDDGGGVQTVAVAEAGLTVEAGTVYVGDQLDGTGTIDVFNSFGLLESTWTGERTLAESFGESYLGIDPVDGHVYAADRQHAIVDEFGSSVSEEPPLSRLTGTPEGSFSEPEAVTIARASEDVYVANDNEARDSVVDVFGPDLEIPEAKTEAASEVKPHSAILNGKVSTGKGGAAKCWFVWGTSPNALTRTAESECLQNPVTGESVPVTAGLKVLAPDTKYYYRLQAAYTANEAAVNLSEEATAECEGKPAEDACFTTPGPGIESESASEVYATSATLHATIEPNKAPTSYHFEYDTTPYAEGEGPHGTSVPVANVPIGAGASPVEVNPEHIQGLTPGTVYHFRVLAVSEIERGKIEDFDGSEASFTTQTGGSFALPDGRQWEMVSPAAKQGALIHGPGEPWGVTQAAAGGEAMTYLTNVPTEKGVVGYANAIQVLSNRTSAGWTSRDLAFPYNGAVGVTDEAGQAYRFFNEQLTEGILQPYGPFQPCHDAQGAPQPCFSPWASEQTAFLQDLQSGEYAPIATGCPAAGEPCAAQIAEHANVPAGTVFGQLGLAGLDAPCPPEKYCGPLFDGASPDGSHVVVHSDFAVQLTEESAPEGGLYEYSAAKPPSEQLQLVSVLPEEKGPASEPWLGSHGTTYGGNGEDARHAISNDGSRVFWTSSRTGGLYVRDTARKETVQIGSLGAQFQTANDNGSRVFFSEAGRLFECELPEKLECDPILLGEAPAESGSVIGASEDGSYVYWVAADHDLYLDHDEGGAWQRTLVAVLSGDDNPDWGHARPELEQLTARVSPDGQYLAFMSDRELTGYDNHDAVSGQPDEEVYLYDAASRTLTCASCDPSGGRPVGVKANQAGLVDEDATGYESGWGGSTWLSADVPAWVSVEKDTARYQPRYLSNEGRLFFDSDDALVPKDIDGTWDVYEYEPEGLGAASGHACTPSSTSGSVVFKPAHEFRTAEGTSGEEPAGCVGLISSGQSPQESIFLDASESGGDVFFMTTAQLAPQDFDDAYDIYDAHECTPSSPCIPNPPGASAECVNTESCRAAPQPEPSIYGSPASATFNGLGNLTPAVVPPPPKKVTKKTVKCKRNFVKKKIKKKQECVRKPKKKKNKAEKSSHGKGSK